MNGFKVVSLSCFELSELLLVLNYVTVAIIRASIHRYCTYGILWFYPSMSVFSIHYRLRFNCCRAVPNMLLYSQPCSQRPPIGRHNMVFVDRVVFGQRCLFLVHMCPYYLKHACRGFTCYLCFTRQLVCLLSDDLETMCRLLQRVQRHVVCISQVFHDRRTNLQWKNFVWVKQHKHRLREHARNRSIGIKRVSRRSSRTHWVTIYM